MRTQESRKPTLVDLFCGAGGISHGFEQIGFRIVGGVDFDADSLVTFATNHRSARSFKGDLSVLEPERIARELEIARGELDCLAGGPPCQGFSRNRAFRHRNGNFVDDPRNYLFWHFFDYVDYFKPTVVVLENVPEMLIKSNGFFRDAVFERFHELGYTAEAKILNAADFGTPQRRRRAIFLAGRDGLRVPFPEPSTRPGRRAGRRTPTSLDSVEGEADQNIIPLFALPVGPSVWDAISDLHGTYATSLNADSAYATEPTTTYQADCREGSIRAKNHFPWPLTERQLRRIRLLGQGQGQLHLPKELQTANGYGSAYRRLQADAVALTITTWMFHPGSGMFTHPFEDRVITIREAARIQSFQDRFEFFGRYHSQCRQVGNAVAPLVARSLAESVLKALGHGANTLPFAIASS